MLNETVAAINSLTVFKGLKEDGVIRALKNLLSEKGETHIKVGLYSEFVAELFKRGYDFSEYLFEETAADCNIYVEVKAHGEEIPEILKRCVECELKVLEKISQITCAELKKFVGYDGYLPDFTTTAIDFCAEYYKRISDVAKSGYGIFAKNIMFRVEDGKIAPVKNPDRRSIERLVGYEKERKIIIDNTVALLENRPASNVLLVGDAGTGKSSSVKAVVNMLAERGLRLIEVRKNQLSGLSEIMEGLRDNPLKFIIFIDDLSFNGVDDNFGALKTILEGSTAIKADNTVIYATSNRRHLVKESFSDRDGDDVHRNDTIQELAALSARFGITVTFSRPSRLLYLDIVHELCNGRGLNMDIKELDRQAEAFALRRGGVSPRVAEQFADSLVAAKKTEG